MRGGEVRRGWGGRVGIRREVTGSKVGGKGMGGQVRSYTLRALLYSL